MDANLQSDWAEYFAFVGTAAGGLTGLIFIALSLHLGAVRSSRAYLVRAQTTLGALIGIVVLAGFVLTQARVRPSLGSRSSPSKSP